MGFQPGVQAGIQPGVQPAMVGATTAVVQQAPQKPSNYRLQKFAISDGIVMITPKAHERYKFLLNGELFKICFYTLRKGHYH